MFIPELLVFHVLRESSTARNVLAHTIRNKSENLYGVYERMYSFVDSLTKDKNLLKLWQGRIGFDCITYLKTAVVLGEHIDLNDELSFCLHLAGKANLKTLNDIILGGILNVFFTKICHESTLLVWLTQEEKQWIGFRLSENTFLFP